MNDERKSQILFFYGVSATFGGLVGVGTSSVCLGIAAAIGMLVYIAKGR